MTSNEHDDRQPQERTTPGPEGQEVTMRQCTVLDTATAWYRALWDGDGEDADVVAARHAEFEQAVYELLQAEQATTGPHASQQKRLAVQFGGRPPEEVIAELAAALRELHDAGAKLNIAYEVNVNSLSALARWEAAQEDAGNALKLVR